MQFKNKLVLLSQQKRRTSKYIKVLINKMYKNTNLRYETQRPLNKNTITVLKMNVLKSSDKQQQQNINYIQYMR